MSTFLQQAHDVEDALGAVVQRVSALGALGGGVGLTRGRHGPNIEFVVDFIRLYAFVSAVS